MLFPVPRSSHGNDPAGTSTTCGSSHPYSQAGSAGQYCGLGCVGDACLWYQIGCFVGCPKCSYSGKDLYVTPEDLQRAGNCTPIAPTINDPELRSYNLGAAAGSDEDWTKVNPWRAPGTAGRGNPDFNPCGYSSGTLNWTAPPATGTRTGMPGTELPELTTNQTVWKAGATVEVEWAIYANHGGGYSYRLCKKGHGGQGITEECFQQTPLAFATDYTEIRYHDGSRAPFSIPAKTTNVGTWPVGSQWRKNPIPMCNCDLGDYCIAGSKRKQFQPYNETHLRPGQTIPTCPTGVQFEASWDEGAGGGAGPKGPKSMSHVEENELPMNPHEHAGGFGTWAFSMVDKVVLPQDSGEYVLSWRWDCEQTPQVWNSCADVTIEAATVVV